jgi:hypothetical protein
MNGGLAFLACSVADHDGEKPVLAGRSLELALQSDRRLPFLIGVYPFLSVFIRLQKTSLKQAPYRVP